MGFDDIDRQFRRTRTIKLECLCCTRTEGVEMENSRTAYHFEGELGSLDDPNKPIPLCRPCAEEHHMHWDDMWAEWRAGLL